jgi:carbon storage regulator
MLVLSRKPGEKLQIGDNITITVLEVHGRVMRIGIEAPGNVRILRGELKILNGPVKPAQQQLSVLKHEPAMAAVAV